VIEIQRRTDRGVSVLAIQGQFDTFSLPAFSEEVERLLGDGARRICINFKGISFINSTTLGYLVDVGKRLRELGGELVFAEPSPFFAATVRTLELHLIFEIFDSDAAAIAHFAG